jgi:hypothetical protein
MSGTTNQRNDIKAIMKRFNLEAAIGNFSLLRTENLSGKKPSFANG